MEDIIEKLNIKNVLHLINRQLVKLPNAYERGTSELNLPKKQSLIVRMDCTNKCNLQCIHCWLVLTRKFLGEPAGEMDVKLFDKIAKQVFPYANTVHISCEAEPTTHSKFLDICSIIKEIPMPNYIITTNGTLLSEEKIRALFECNIKCINISIDGSTPETFERIRRNGNFKKVVEGIGIINRIKEELGRGRDDFPTLQINYTLMKSTIHELPLMVEMCNDWKIHRLTLQHIYGFEKTGLEEESLMKDKELSDTILYESKIKCEAYGIQNNFSMPL